MRHAHRVIGLAAVVLATTSCGNVATSSRAPAYLIIDNLTGASGANPSTFGNPVTSDVLTLVTKGGTCTVAAPCPTYFNDLGQAILRLALKDVGTTATPNAPTSNNEITISQYHVDYQRADGRNTQGVDVPFAFDNGLTATVPAAGNVTVAFELVRNNAKKEAPLVQLVTNTGIINTIANVTFYGADRAGNAVSVTGHIAVNFGNFGDP